MKKFLALLLFLSLPAISKANLEIIKTSPRDPLALNTPLPPPLSLCAGSQFENEKPIRILSIDGGGVRGIAPAKVIAYIEEQTGKPVSELFDLLIGTSTGSILAVALTTPTKAGTPAYSGKDMVELYRTRVQEIFTKSSYQGHIDGIIGPKYEAEPLLKILEEVLKGQRLNQSLAHVIVPAVNLKTNKVHFFKSYEESKNSSYLKKDVCRASSAAPTFFPPAVQPSSIPTNPLEYYVDGGMAVNNPALSGAVEVLKDFGRRPLYIISLGTGSLDEISNPEVAESWGKLEWAVPALMMLMHAQSDKDDTLLKELLKEEEGGFYYRFQFPLTEEQVDIDNTSPENIRSLEEKVEEEIKARKEELSQAMEKMWGIKAKND